MSDKVTKTHDEWTGMIAVSTYITMLLTMQMCVRLVNLDGEQEAKADSAKVCNERIRVAKSAHDSLRVITYYPACR